MAAKVCFKCGVEKELSEFYSHPRMGDGHLNKCKECTKSDVRSHYKASRDERAAYERKRSQSPERRRKALEYQRNRRKNRPDRYAARQAVANALGTGKLQKLPCQICGTTFRIQAHHEDYSKPLDVEWLCFNCHRTHRHGQTVIVATA